MSGWAQDIMGKWMTEAGDAQVEIYQQGGIVMFPACSVANLQSFFFIDDLIAVKKQR